MTDRIEEISVRIRDNAPEEFKDSKLIRRAAAFLLQADAQEKEGSRRGWPLGDPLIPIYIRTVSDALAILHSIGVAMTVGVPEDKSNAMIMEHYIAHRYGLAGLTGDVRDLSTDENILPAKIRRRLPR